MEFLDQADGNLNWSPTLRTLHSFNWSSRNAVKIPIRLLICEATSRKCLSVLSWSPTNAAGSGEPQCASAHDFSLIGCGLPQHRVLSAPRFSRSLFSFSVSR